MENQYEEELGLSAMLLSICLRWRVLLITALVCTVVIGGTKLAMNIQGISDSEAIEKAKTHYEEALAAYNAEGETIELEMEENRRILRVQTDYNAKSMLMKIDPRNEWYGSLNLYIDTGYQIMPGSSIQNENPAYKIVCAYYDYYNSGEFYTTVMDKLSFDMEELKYLREILAVSFDTSRYAITIKVVADTEAHCEELVRVAGDAFQSRYSFITSSLGEHTMKGADIVIYTQINTDREAFQTAQEAAEKTLLQKVPVLNEKYSDWQKAKSEITVPITDLAGAVRGGIKWIIIAAVAGFFVSAVFFFLKYLFSGKIREAGSLGMNSNILAELPCCGGKKKNRIDCLICRIFEVSVKESEYDSRVEAMSVSLGKMLQAMSGKGSVAFVGDVKEEELRTLTEQTAKMLPADYKVVAAGNMIVDTAAAKSAYEADAVVLVVKQNESLKKTYEQFVSKLASCKVKVLGTVLMGVVSI